MGSALQPRSFPYIKFPQTFYSPLLFRKASLYCSCDMVKAGERNYDNQSERNINVNFCELKKLNIYFIFAIHFMLCIFKIFVLSKSYLNSMDYMKSPVLIHYRMLFTAFLL